MPSSTKATLSGLRLSWWCLITAWMNQTESATPSPGRNAFWRVLNGRWISIRCARIRWKHLTTMSDIFIGRYFAGSPASAHLGSSTVWPRRRRLGRHPANSHRLKWPASSAAEIALTSESFLPSSPGVPSFILLRHHIIHCYRMHQLPVHLPNNGKRPRVRNWRGFEEITPKRFLDRHW